jgi:general secretion pathway protein G
MVKSMRSPRLSPGFTIVELLVVLAVIGMLLAIAAPRYVRHLDTAREAVLRQDLLQLRDSIDMFHADQSRYPASLQELVAMRYLRAVPIDPVTDRADTWRVSAPPDTSETSVFDVHSGAGGVALDGSAYASW